MKMTNIMKANISTYPTALRLLAVLFFFCLFTLPAAGQEGDGTVSKIENQGGGNGTKGNPILIANAGELAYFAKQVNGKGNLTVDHINGDIIYENGFSCKYFALSSDIDLNGKDWTPIGVYRNEFRAHFDGQGHVVKGLKVDMSNGSDVIFAGLFGCIYDGTIQNLGVELSKDGIKAGSTDGSVYAGGIVGKITGSNGAATIRNCYVTGEGGVVITGYSLSGFAYAGGIAGWANQSFGGTYIQSVTLTHCYATVDVEGNANGVGGILGKLENGTLSFTYATGKVTGKYRSAGGICGDNSGKSLTDNLALNGVISGGSTSGRVLGRNTSSTQLGPNYANSSMTVNGNYVSGTDAGSNSGADTWLDSFKDDLIGTAPNETAWKDAWTWPTDGNTLPRLKMITGEDADGNPTGYAAWTSGVQPLINAVGLLPARPTLHIVKSDNGVLQVFDKASGKRKELFDGDAVTPGTILSLEYTVGDYCRFDGFFSGSSANDVMTPVDGSLPMPATDLWLRASFTYVPPYTVTLSAVEGATTDPAPGSYAVEAGKTFRFYLTLDPDYSESQPVVTTDRGETLEPRNSDGAYLVENVDSNVQVFIDGLYPNPPVANESITDPHSAADSALPQISTEPSALCILLPDGFFAGADASTGVPVRILSPDGRLVETFKAALGLNRRPLPMGVYIVWIGETVRKVVVRN